MSIIICCYNSSSRISRTLIHIANQKSVENIDFELIIVDNASTDETAKISQQFLEQTKLNYKIVYQPVPGLSAARMMGVENARFDLILFCDDDNFLDEHYIFEGEKVLRSDEEIMLLGGIGEPLFEGVEPKWFKEYDINFACGLVPNAKQDTLSHVKEAYGAGLFVRMDFFKYLNKINFRSVLSDRKGTSLMSGGDTEYCITANYAGFKIAIHPKLSFKHLMPVGRMNLEYLKKLHFGFGRTRLYTQAYQYVFSNDQMPNVNLKHPLWKDKLSYKKRELMRFYPKIWFLALNEKNLDVILQYEALKGEIEELKSLKNRYSAVFQDIFLLKKSIEKFKKD